MLALVRTTVLTMVLLVACGVAASSAGAYVFWSDVQGGPKIKRAGVAGGGVTSLRSLLWPAYAMAVDDRYVYWADETDETIGRMRLDGSEPDGAFIDTGAAAGGVAVDDAHIYWSDDQTGTIHRADLDGTDPTVLVSVPGMQPRGLAVDDTYIYWGQNGTGDVGRATLDGVTVQPSWIVGAAANEGVAVSATHVYWARADGIGRAAIDGSGVDVAFIPGQNTWSVAVDSRHVYWSDLVGDAIRRADLDGSDVEDLVGALPYGLAVNAGPLVVFGPSPSFPDTVVDATSATRTVTVTNEGGADLIVSGVSLTGADADQFAIDSNTCVGVPIAPSASCTVNLHFAPTSAGSKTAAVTVTSDAPSSPDSRSISATALAKPAVTFGAAPAFPDTIEGQSGPTRTLTVTNSGGSPLIVGGVSLTGADADQFAIDSNTCVGVPIAVSGSCSVNLHFAPTSAGSKTAAVTVTSDAPSSPDSRSIAATALALPAVSFGPAPVFPDTAAGESSPTRTVTVTNGGGSPLTVGGVALTGADAGQFAILGEDCTGAPLVAAASCTVTLGFAPTSSGPKSAALTVTSDASTSPDSLPIAATSPAPAPPPAAARPPLVVAIQPASGTSAGGERVLLIGSYLSPVTEVRFGGTPGAFEVLGFDRLVAIAPPHAPGTADVVVVGPGGTSAPVSYRYDAPLASLVPPALVPPPARTCVVPDLDGRRRGEARRALERAGCALGEVRRTKGAPLRRQRVARQSVAPGTTVAAGTEVGIRLRRQARG